MNSKLSSEREHGNVFNYAFSHTVTTTDAADVINGDGDLFLTLSATIAVSRAIIVSVTNPQCIASSQEKLSWNFDDKPTLNWVSAGDIKNEIIVDLQDEMKTLLINLNYSNYEEFKAAGYNTKPRNSYAAMTDNKWEELLNSTAQLVRDNNAIHDWTGLLNYNEYLKRTATKFVDMYQHIDYNHKEYIHFNEGENPFANREYLDAAVDTKNSQGRGPTYIHPYKSGSSLNTPSGYDASYPANVAAIGVTQVASWLLLPAAALAYQVADGIVTIDRSLNPEQLLPDIGVENMIAGAHLTTDDNVNSFTLLGGGHSIELELKTSIETKSANDFSKDFEIKFGGSTEFGVKIVDVGLTVKLEQAGEFIFHHNIKQELSKKFENTIKVTLADPDVGDQFKFQILKDDIYGSPVYKVIAGKSRCMSEANTVPRDEVEFLFDNSNSIITNALPDAPVATIIKLTNKSPTKDDFTYSLILEQNSNRNGLALLINGQVLNSDTNVLQFDLKYLEELPLVIEARRPPSALYSFSGLELSILSTANDVTCYKKTQTLSINYLSPCNQVSFVGRYTADFPFTINTLTLTGGKTSVPIIIYNKERTIPWRRWYVKAAAGELTGIYMEYRRVDSDTWLVAADDDVVNGQFNLVLPTTTQAINQDLFVFNWKVDELPEGEYMVRVRSECITTPISQIAQDLGMYEYVGPLLRGRIDLIKPKIFGFPVPSSVEKYIPGTLIAVTFTEPVDCKRLVVRYWFTPTSSVSLAYNLADATAAGAVVVSAVNILCYGESVHIELSDTSSYVVNAGKVLTMNLLNIFDIAGNQMEGASGITWSFGIANLAELSPFVRGYSYGSSNGGVCNNCNSSMDIGLTLSLAHNVSLLLDRYGSTESILSNINSELVKLIQTVKSVV